MLGNKVLTKLNKISMSDNSVKRRIDDLISDVLAQIVQGAKNSAFSAVLQLNGSTNVACIGQLLVFVQKGKKKFELKKKVLLCENLQITAAATDVMNLIKDSFKT